MRDVPSRTFLNAGVRGCVMVDDIILPQGNEKELAEMAARLGMRSLLALYPIGRVPTSLPKLACDVVVGTLCDANRAEAALQNGGIVALISSEVDKNVFERRSAPSLLLGVGETTKGDRMHQREGGLNQPLARSLAKHGTIVVLALSSLLQRDGEQRAQLLGRWMQNAAICRKANVRTLIASCASTPYGLRAAAERKSIGVIVGLHEAEALTAF